MLTAFALLALPLTVSPQQSSDPPKNPAPFVFENGSPGDFIDVSGVFHLSHGDGWLRTRQVHHDFTLTALFKLNDATTDAGIGIRALTGGTLWPKYGYHVVLSAKRSSGAIEARGMPITIVSSSPLPSIATDEWHTLVLIATGSRIHVSIDEHETGVADVEDTTGVMLMDVQRGSVDVRSFAVADAGSGTYIDPNQKTEPSSRKVTAPRLRKEVKPNYSDEALRRKIEGVVKMDAIVEPDGTVRAVSITKYLHPDLEQQAVHSLLQWRFAPASLDGKPVRLLIAAELSFTLREKK